MAWGSGWVPDIGPGTSLLLLHNAGLAYQAGLPGGYTLDPFRALWLATSGSARLLQVLGDDSAVRRTYVMGRCAWDRDGEPK